MSGIDWSKAPEGATHYWPGNSRFYEKVGDVYFVAGEQRYGSVHAPDSWVKKLTPRPSPSWNGEGLPPVGVDIEFKSSAGEWLTGQYIGQFNGKIIAGCHATGVVGYLQSGEMRPIRTPEQIAADEREAAVEDMLRLFGGTDSRDTYLMQRLYDAGYRKQEQPK